MTSANGRHSPSIWASHAAILFEELNMRQDVREQLGMVGPEAPLQSGLEVWLLFPQAAFRELR